MAFRSFDGQMETDGEEGGEGGEDGTKKKKKLSHVKINWNRMVVGAGWWLASAGGASLQSPAPVPQLIPPPHPAAPLPGKGQSEAENHRDSLPVSPVTPLASPYPPPPVPSAPRSGRGGVSVGNIF